ncbi:MAG: caspase family protein, partial [Pseudomonadota bacterium]
MPSAYFADGTLVPGNGLCPPRLAARPALLPAPPHIMPSSFIAHRGRRRPRRAPRAVIGAFAGVALAAGFMAGVLDGAGQPARADAGLSRFAIIAGNDRGGSDTRPLLYAKDDARKVWEILTRLGSVRPEDATLLQDGDARGFLAALGDAERRARDAGLRGERTALIVYYSGHAKDGALRLGDSQLPLASLKARLGQAPFGVRIGIFDACQSGALTRTKGARKAPAFEIDTRGAREALGTVILTSSASDEDSQESDLIG